MPQMAPILWLPMFTITLATLFMVTSLVYFSKSESSTLVDLTQIKIKSTNWAW